MPTSPESDAIAQEAALLGRIGRGDREAFRQLYGRYSTALFSLALRFVGNSSEAEELLQDAFVKIWRHAARYDSAKSRPFTWAVTILRRTCVDHLRKRGRQGPAAAEADRLALPEDLPARDDVRDSAESHEAADRVHLALADFPPAQRTALELALYSELTHAEIALRLAQPVGTIKTWIRRGLAGLRASLSELLP